MNDERELRPADPHYRPQPISASRVMAAEAAFRRLLAEPPDFVRRLNWGRQTIEFFEHENRTWLSSRDEAYLRELGFRPLCHTLTHTPGAFGELAVRSELWIDPTATIKVEVRGSVDWGAMPDEAVEDVGAAIGTVFISTYFDDGTSVLMLPDNLFTEDFQGERRIAMSGTEDVMKDLPQFLGRRDALLDEGKVPLPCADVVMYAKHHEVHARHLMSRDTITQALGMELGVDLMSAVVLIGIGIGLWLWTSTNGAIFATMGIATLISMTVKFVRSFGDRYPQDEIAEAIEGPIDADGWADSSEWVH